MCLNELRIFQQVEKKNNEAKYCSLHLRGNFTLNSVISLSLFNINKTQNK